MNKPTVYIETTVIGHIAAWDQTDVLVYARQIQSRRWWAIRERFDLAVSLVVIDECATGDSIAASERLALIAGIPILTVSDDVQSLADKLIYPSAVKPQLGKFTTRQENKRKAKSWRTK